VDVRIAAYRALQNIGTPRAKGILVQAADDKTPEVKAAVRQLLGMR
jgi:HEAT repeat protein